MADEDLSTHWEETEGQTAKETAAATDNHFWWGTDGAHISSTGDHDTSGFHQLMTSVRNAFMHGTTELMTISENLIELGKNSASAVISMCAGRLRIAFEPLLAADATLSSVISSDGPLGLKSDSITSVVYSHTVTEADAERGSLVPLGTQLESRLYASVGDDEYASMLGILLRTKTPSQGSSQAAHVILRDGIAGISGGPTIEVITPNVDTSASLDRLATAIQPVVLYNGGAALDYDTAPGAGTTGTVTLSETAANFKEITIFGNYGGFCTSVTLTNPDGGTSALQLFIPNAGPATLTYVKSRAIAISGTNITNAGWTAMWLSATETHFDANSAPEIAITRVEGRR